MKEYGGYMSFENFNGEEYHKNALRFDSVRSCLSFIINKRKYKKIFIPYYLCKSISHLLDYNNIKYDYFYITNEFLPILNHHTTSDECVFLVNYFGQISNKLILKLQELYGNIFVDNTQSFFQIPVDGIDTAYCCRKYFGIADGAYLYTAIDSMDVQYPYEVSHNKVNHLIGRYEQGAEAFLNYYKELESIPRGNQIKHMSLFTSNVLRGLDYDCIINIRKRNFIKLHDNLKYINTLQVKLNKNDGLYLYPLLINNGEKLKMHLIKKKIYIPTLWPDLHRDIKPFHIEYKYASDLVLLPIDHRYNENDMDNICDAVHHILTEIGK